MLKQIQGQVTYHVKHRVSNPRRSTKIRVDDVNFVCAGSRTDNGQNKNITGEIINIDGGQRLAWQTPDIINTKE